MIRAIKLAALVDLVVIGALAVAGSGAAGFVVVALLAAACLFIASPEDRQ